MLRLDMFCKDRFGNRLIGKLIGKLFITFRPEKYSVGELKRSIKPY